MTKMAYKLKNTDQVNTKHRNWKNATITFYLVMAALALIGQFTFSAWQQVQDLFNYHVPFEALYGHPHFFRYLIAYPGLLLSEIYGEEMFSLYIVTYMTLSIYLMYYLLKDAKSSLIFLGCAAVFILHIFMNGRGAISWLGWMLILYVIFKNGDYKENILNLPILLLALLMCSVSSGTFSVGYISIILFYGYRFFKSVKYLNPNVFFIVVISAFILYLYYDLFLSGIFRNLDYYRLGSQSILYNMLKHGFGSVVLEHPFYISLGVGSVVIVLSYLFFSLQTKPTVRELIVIGVPLAGGVFGYTTMSLAIPSIFLVLFARIGGIHLVTHNRAISSKAVGG